jgi:hypothetical protein
MVDCCVNSYWYRTSLIALLVSHAAPPPPLELPLDELLLDDELAPELPLDELLLDEDAPVSGFAASATLASVPLSVAEEGGSFAPLASGAAVVAATSAPRPSSGDVAQADAAEMRATRDRAATQVRVERRMAGTLAAELCTWRPARLTRRSGDSYVVAACQGT